MRNTKAITKWMTGAALAGALMFGVPHKAQAQVSFGIGVGNYAAPAYAPAYDGYANPYAYEAWQRQRYIEHEQRERWEAERAAQWRHEQWEREHFYGRDHDGYHDHGHEDRDWHHDGYRY